MVVRKIIEKTLEAGQTTITITDTDIPGSLIRTYSNDPDLMPVQIVLTGSTLKIDYEAQSTDKYVAVELVKQGLDIIDNLTSTDTDAALSAKQGKVLKDLVDGITPIRNLTELDDVLVTNLTDGDILKYNSDDEVFKNYALPDIPVYLGDLGDIVLNTVSQGQVLTYNGAYWTNEYSAGSINYSTAETVIGTWLNKPLYRKVVDCGALPNATIKTVAHGISNLDRICKYDCIALNTTTKTNLPVPIPVSLNSTSSNLISYIDTTNIGFNTGTNLSSYDSCYAILEYTKTTD